MLRFAAKKVADQNIQNAAFLHGDAHYLPFKHATFDAAVCCGSLHLFDDVPQVLNELRRVIKSNGRFATAVFFRKPNPIGTLKAYMRKKIWGIHSFREQELKDLFLNTGFEPTVHHKWGLWMIAGGIRDQRSGFKDRADGFPEEGP